ncbi:putative ORFan [Tupanvirus deep ocean]|uniref:ORFan n=2 Tax=Tupanvirus TaxID=2094720 RepID=A0AC62AA59_9VIRU|nr:putative ORFan [Tupanvirus deep ocean]QKU34631.1 putative ORFan [Tupanvirus deep ocean]
MDAIFEFEEDLLNSKNDSNQNHYIPIVDEKKCTNEFDLHISHMHNNTQQSFINLSNMDSEILISDVKFLVSFFSKGKIPVRNQILTYCEETLMDDKTLGFYKITALSSVCLEFSA